MNRMHALAIWTLIGFAVVLAMLLGQALMR